MAQQSLHGAEEGKVAFSSFLGWDWTRVAETHWLRLRAQAAKGGLVSYCCCKQFPQREQLKPHQLITLRLYRCRLQRPLG